MPDQVKTIDDPLFHLLKDEKIQEFNAALESSEEKPNFSFCDFRGTNLRGLNADGINFTGAYFRGCDLRGIDFSKSNLESASIANSHISGCYFPRQISCDELLMSMNHGTRMRYNLPPKISLVKKT